MLECLDMEMVCDSSKFEKSSSVIKWVWRNCISVNLVNNSGTILPLLHSLACFSTITCVLKPIFLHNIFPTILVL